MTWVSYEWSKTKVGLNFLSMAVLGRTSRRRQSCPVPYLSMIAPPKLGLMLPSKQLGGSEAVMCLYANLPFFRNQSVQETPVGYEVRRLWHKTGKQIGLETRLHNNFKYGCPQGPLCASLLNQMNQLLELLVMVVHEREFIRGCL